MAKAVATVGVSVVARTKNFRRGMKRAQSTTKRFAASIKKMSMRVVKFGAVLTGVAVGAMAVMVKRSFTAIDATAKLAARLNLTTEALTGLRHAADIMGSSYTGMDKALEQFVRRLGEAQVKTGETRDALNFLGLDANKLSKMKTDEAFKVAAEAIGKLKDATLKADSAYRLFGRRGVELVNTLSLGRKGLDEMASDAKRLGITFNKLDAAKIENANDAITRMKSAFVGAANAAALKFAPFVDFAAKKVTEFVIVFRKSFGTGISKAIDIGIAAIDRLIKKLMATKAKVSFWAAGVFKIAAKAASAMGFESKAKGLQMTAKGFFASGKAMEGAAKLAGKGPTRKVFDSIIKASQDAAKKSIASGKGSMFDGFVGGVQKFIGKARVLGDKAGAAMGKSFKDQMLAIAGLGKGGFFAKLATVKPKKDTEGSAASFREVDLSRVSIGPGNKRGDKAQRVEDPETKRSANWLAKIHGKIAAPGLA